MTSRKSTPFPPWLLAADLLATGLLALGLLIVFSPQALPALAMDPAVAWTMVVFGAAGMLVCGLALFRHLRHRTTHR
jgi:uncharacterized protein involved in exopolysaccharide biosynthesis